jgi:hypothetical protein
MVPFTWRRAIAGVTYMECGRCSGDGIHHGSLMVVLAELVWYTSSRQKLRCSVEAAQPLWWLGSWRIWEAKLYSVVTLLKGSS